MAKFKIKRDDMVIVTAGKNRGQKGEVLKLFRDDSKVIVEKVNLVQRQVKPKGDQPGGTVEKEAPIHISNVALWDDSEGRKVKVGWKKLDDGSKKRFDKKTGQVIDA